MAKLRRQDIKEPSIIVRPIARFGGLDNIHIALTVLVVILILMLLFLSYTKQIVIRNVTNSTNCTYGATNGSCVSPSHNASQIKLIAERLLASYASINGSVSALPYSSNVNAMSITYIQSAKAWYVTVPLTIQTTPTTYFSTLISDSNTSNIVPFIQAVQPSRLSSNYVVSSGVVRLSNQTSCSNLQGQLKVFWFVDPYSPGGINTLSNLTALEQQYSGKVNFTVWILFAQYYQQIANRYNTTKAQALGSYLYCASKQGYSQFAKFTSALNSVYVSAYISPAVLSNVSISAGLNMSQVTACLTNYPLRVPTQLQVAQYYGITSTPSVLADCQYLSIPQTARQAICYANSLLC